MLKELNRLMKAFKDIKKRSTNKEDKLYFEGVYQGLRRARQEYKLYKVKKG